MYGAMLAPRNLVSMRVAARFLCLEGNACPEKDLYIPSQCRWVESANHGAAKSATVSAIGGDQPPDS